MSEIEPYEERDDEPKWAGDPKQMGFLDHLEELRWTLLKPLVVFVAAFFASMVFIKDVKDILLSPLESNYSHLTEAERAVVFAGLTTMNVTGVFVAMLLIGIIIGLMAASPVIIYYAGKFLAPALTVREKKILVPGSFAVLILFLLGCTFGYFFLLPRTIMAVIWFNNLLGFQLLWTTSNYFGFLTFTILGLGLAFQMPLAIVVLVSVGVVTPQQLRTYRRYIVLSIVITAAILTPPEPITQLALAIPLWVLYEVAILVSVFLKKKVDEKEKAEFSNYEVVDPQGYDKSDEYHSDYDYDQDHDPDHDLGDDHGGGPHHLESTSSEEDDGSESDRVSEDQDAGYDSESDDESDIDEDRKRDE
ncbi:MAG TPA: twin-arginine translocase subunit TatC [Opitutae bacterium]|nr:twin-arginine translocase subunit TatC [Opitutae bacterium]